MTAAALWSPQDGWRPGPWRLSVAGDRIASIAPSPGGGDGLVVTPTLANAHDHGRALSTLAAGIADAPLELWLPALFLHPHIPPELNAAVALGRMAAAGIGSVLLFDGQVPPDQRPARVAAIARAARAVGLRVAVACSLRDRNRLAYDGGAAALARLSPALAAAVCAQWDVPAAPAAAQVAGVLAAGQPGVDVQLAPVGPVWTSEALLAETASAARAHGLRIHTHLAETRRQAGWARAAFPQGLLPHLDALGLLGPHLACAHGVWLTATERRLLARRGVTVVLNTSSNLRLGSGLPRAAALARSGIRLALGLDSAALDDDADLWREWRLAHVTQPAWDGADAAAFGTGHAVCAAPEDTGRLVPGAPADFCVLDLAAVAPEALPGADWPALLRGRATARHVRHVWVAGRQVARDGLPTGLDLPAAEAELRDRARSLAPELDARLALLPVWRAALAAAYGFTRPGMRTAPEATAARQAG